MTPVTDTLHIEVIHSHFLMERSVVIVVTVVVAQAPSAWLAPSVEIGGLPVPPSMGQRRPLERILSNADHNTKQSSESRFATGWLQSRSANDDDGGDLKDNRGGRKLSVPQVNLSTAPNAGTAQDSCRKAPPSGKTPKRRQKHGEAVTGQTMARVCRPEVDHSRTDSVWRR